MEEEQMQIISTTSLLLMMVRNAVKSCLYYQLYIKTNSSVIMWSRKQMWAKADEDVAVNYINLQNCIQICANK